MLHQIGVGALGPVFRTYEPTRDRLVAVKVFRLDVTPEQARALADELGRAADAGLFHPSIVEPVAAGLEGTVAYRAEEYVAAESLDVAMRHYAPATLDKVLPFITQLASAIDFARAAGVGHGALHPRDIFVTPDEARATGFGVVDAMDRLGLRAPVRRPYSPPERIAGQPWNTTADVFSLAAIAFELLTGRRPSGVGEDMGALSGASLGDRADGVRAVLAKAMQENPENRYQTAQEFSAALAAAAEIAETPVAVAPRPSATPAAAAISAAVVAPKEPEIIIGTPAPLEPASELPLTLGVPAATADVELAFKDAVPHPESHEEQSAAVHSEQALDDFAGERGTVSPTDSPREAARKAIAARKRQHKKKAESALFEAPREAQGEAPILPAEAMAAMPEVMPIPLASEPSVDEETPVSEEAAAPLGATTTGLSDLTDEAGADDAPDLIASSNTEDDVTAHEPLASPKSVFPAMVSTDQDIDLVVTDDAPALEAVELEHNERNFSDRVVAVDEFRAREAAGTKAERSRPRAPERAALDRPQFERADRSHSPSSSPSLSLGGNAAQPETVSQDGGSRQRMMMLPLALVAGLCLIVGYGVGYFVRGREAIVPPSSAGTAATTGTSKTSSDGVVPPSSAPAVPAEGGSEPPKAVSSPPAPAPTPKPAVPAAAPRASNTSSAKTGRVVINSSPAKAGVTINGKWTGRTPLTLTDLKFGRYVIRIVEPGYEVQREQFTLSSSSASRNVDVTLKRKPGAKPAPAPAAASAQPQAAAASKPGTAQTGTIFVDSRPQGARVFVDDKEQGVTPLTLDGQAPGSRTVRLELPDHSPRTEKVTVKPGATARVTRSLERIR